MFENQRCIHRHKWPKHKSCFLKGRILKEKASPVVKVSPVAKVESGPLPWYKNPNIKIGAFDIETTGLEGADIELMITWAVKEKDGKTSFDSITKSELFDGSFDERIVRSCVDAISKLDIIVGYWSKRFDLPFLRAKALHYGIDFPDFTNKYHWDLYDTIKAKFNLSRRSLDVATHYFGIEGKTHLDRPIWLKARYGDKESLAYVLEHNIADVDITMQLLEKIEFSRKWVKSVI
jgi:DNA polymerase elongation subunit (family B)